MSNDNLSYSIIYDNQKYFNIILLFLERYIKYNYHSSIRKRPKKPKYSRKIY